MHHEFIINPTAGKHNDLEKILDVIEAACKRHNLKYNIGVANRYGVAAAIAAGIAAADEPTRIYAVGGDGTLSEVVQAAAGAEHIAVTNLPTGTGNDFLKIFGKTYREDFWDLDALFTDSACAALDVIDCNGRLGLDVVCAGVDARVAASVNRYKTLPLVKGKGAYILSLIRNVLFTRVARPMTVHVDGTTWSQPTSILCICNGRYYGGGFMPVPDAMPDDGILDVLLVPKIPLLTFARLVGKYAKGKYADYPDIIEAHHTSSPIIYESDTPIVTVVDGEITISERFTVSLSDKKLNFFWPAKLSYQVEKPPAAAAL